MIAQDLKGVYQAIRAVLLMARRELAFPIDEVEYTAMLTQSTDSALSQMDSVIREMRTEIDRKIEIASNESVQPIAQITGSG